MQDVIAKFIDAFVNAFLDTWRSIIPTSQNTVFFQQPVYFLVELLKVKVMNTLGNTDQVDGTFFNSG